jgi:hypothetical protein
LQTTFLLKHWTLGHQACLNEIRDGGRYLYRFFEAKKHFGLCVLTYMDRLSGRNQAQSFTPCDG